MSGSGSGREQGRGSLHVGFRLRSIAGIEIRLNASSAVIFALIAVGLAVWQFPAVNPGQPALTYAIAGVLTAAVFLASVLAHEVAHSLVALHYGLRVRSITLWLFGGVSDLGGEPPGPGSEARIAAAGPLTSLLLGAVFAGLAVAVRASGPARDSLPGVIYSALAYLAITNVALFVFNVIPAAPLDGGRLLRSVIWWRTRDRVQATVWADRAGQFFGAICIVGGLFLFFITRNLGWIWIALIGWFLYGAATTEARQAVLSGQLRGIRVGQVMTPDPVTVPGSMTVGQFLGDYLFAARHQSFPVTADGGNTVTGLVTLNRIKHVRPGERDHTRVADVACPLADVATAAPEESVADVLPRLTECADQRALVFSDGHLSGIITPTDISRVVNRLGLDRSR
jgi:Zn-dependent protease/CBS domain-containing protein